METRGSDSSSLHEKRKEANPITLKVFDKMPGLKAWLLKIAFDLNMVQVCFGLCLLVNNQCIFYNQFNLVDSFLILKYKIACLLSSLILYSILYDGLD